MPRARNIKPSFFTNEDLVDLPVTTRLLFIGLWTLADRLGRLPDKPKQIKLNLFPADNFNIDRALNQLQEKKFILRYVVENERYILIYNFTKHQSPHVREQPSTIPAPDEHGASTGQARLNPERGKRKGESKHPPENLESKSEEEIIRLTEKVLGFGLDAPSQMVLVEAIPPPLVSEWIQFTKSRMVGNYDEPPNFIRKKIGYWVGDFRKEHKADLQQLPKTNGKPNVCDRCRQTNGLIDEGGWQKCKHGEK